MQNSRIARLALCFSFTGCAIDDDRRVELPPSEAYVTCEVPDGFELMADGAIVVEGDIAVSTVDELRADCDAGRPWHGFSRTPRSRRFAPYGAGVTAASDKWPGGDVSYMVDPTLPEPDRVVRAIEAWEATDTAIHFHYNFFNDPDYVYFTNGSSCHSPLGRQRGRQDIIVSTSQSAADIVGSGISSHGNVYTWFANGLVMAGSPTELDSVLEAHSYTLPDDYTPDQIVAMAISKDSDRVYTWYDDDTMTVGSTSDLDLYAGPRLYAHPAGKNIIDIDFDSATGFSFTWYDDGTMSQGTSLDLASRKDSALFKVADGELRSRLRGVAFGTGNKVWAWYSDNQVSSGSTIDLDSQDELAEFDIAAFECADYKLVHELGHAIGVAHEHNRTDRGDHVRIFRDNISEAGKRQFDIIGADAADIGNYDINSRMHYESFGFSSNDSPTMLGTRLPGEPVLASLFVDMAISPAGNVYTWWSDNWVTVGHPDDLESVTARYHYSSPKPVSTIVGIGIAPSTSDVYTFYLDGTRSIGHSDNLDTGTGTADYSLPSPYKPGDILSIDIAPSGHFYAWFKDGFVSSGTSTDLGFYTKPVKFKVADGKSRDDVLGIAIATSSSCYAWYKSGSVSSGTSTDLDEDRPLYNFINRLDIITSSRTLTAGDIATVNAMYPN